MREFIIINKIGSEFINNELLKNNGKITILDQEYFYPEIENKYTDNTYAYHMANTSWIPLWKRFLYKIPFYYFIKSLFYKILPRFVRNKIFKTLY